MAKQHQDRSNGGAPNVSEVVRVPHGPVSYQQMVALLDELIDEVGDDEQHPLASLMEVLGVLVERYEAEHVPELNSE